MTGQMVGDLRRELDTERSKNQKMVKVLEMIADGYNPLIDEVLMRDDMSLLAQKTITEILK